MHPHTCEAGHGITAGTCYPVLGSQSQAVPWVLLASQLILLAKFQASERLSQKPKYLHGIGEQPLRLTSGLHKHCTNMH